MLDKLYSSHLSTSGTVSLKTQQTQVAMSRDTATNLNKSVELPSNAKIQVPSFCDTAKSSRNDPSLDCSKLTMSQKTSLTQTAAAGRNGNDANLNGSMTLGMSLFDEANSKMTVTNLARPIDFYIPRNTHFKLDDYECINVSNYTNCTTTNTTNDIFIQRGVNLTSDSAVFIQLKPAKTSSKIGYLFLMKLGSAPSLSATKSKYDLWKMFCPSDMVTFGDDSYHLFFVNMTFLNRYRGLVGFALRELSRSEIQTHCSNNQTNHGLTSPPVLDSVPDCKYVSSDFELRIFLSSCMYMDTVTGAWSTAGTDVMEDTTVNVTHCQVYHLTEFASGFIVLPSAINFDDVWANASIDKNPVIYATLFTVIGLYVVLAVACRLFDMRDDKKRGVTMLNEDHTENLYEVIVFTGGRKDASTESKANKSSFFSSRHSFSIAFFSF